MEFTERRNMKMTKMTQNLRNKEFQSTISKVKTCSVTVRHRACRAWGYLGKTFSNHTECAHILEDVHSASCDAATWF
jgi:hypothetical protein